MARHTSRTYVQTSLKTISIRSHKQIIELIKGKPMHEIAVPLELPTAPVKMKGVPSKGFGESGVRKLLVLGVKVN